MYLFLLCLLLTSTLKSLAQQCKSIPPPINEKVCLVGKTVTRLSSQALYSDYIPPTTLALNVTGIQAGLRIDFTTQKIIGIRPPIVPGFIDVILNNTVLGLGLDLVAGGVNNEIPVAINFPICFINPLHIYEADTATPPISSNITIKYLISLITEQLPIIFCENITTSLAKNITLKLENELDPKLTAIIGAQASVVPQFGPDYVDWNDSLFSLLQIVGAQIGKGKIWECFTEKIPFLQNLKRPLINSIIDRLTGGTGSFDIDLSKNGTYPTKELAGKNFSLVSLSIGGLDTFNDISLMAPTPSSSVTLTSHLGLDYILIELGVLEVNGTGYEEELNIVLNISDVKLSFDLAAAMNKTRLHYYYLNQINNMDCFVQLFDYYLVSSLDIRIDISQIAILSVTGSATDKEGTTALVDNLFALLTQGYGQMITDVIAGIFQGPLRESLNKKIDDKYAEIRANGTCPPPPVYDPAAPPNYIVWNDAFLISLINTFVNGLIGPRGVNNIMNCITDGTGAISISAPTFDLSLSGLNTFTDLKLFAPMIQNDLYLYDLETALGIGSLTVSLQSVSTGFNMLTSMIPSNPVSSFIFPDKNLDDFPNLSFLLKPLDTLVSSMLYNTAQLTSEAFALESSKSLQSSPADVVLPSDWSLYIYLQNFFIDFTITAEVDKTKLETLQVDQLPVQGCFGSVFGELKILTETAKLDNATLTIKQGTQILPLTGLVSKILSFLTSTTKIEKRNAQIAYSLSVAQETCDAGGIAPPSPSPVSPSSSSNTDVNATWKWEISIIVIGAILALLIFASAYYQYNKQGNQDMLEYYNLEDSCLGSIFSGYQIETALVFQTKIPFWIRVTFPIAIIANIALFIYSNLSPDAVTVEAHITLGAKQITPSEPIFAFGLSNTVQDMWDAEVYPLAILIAFFSGAWPYIKLGVMFVAWILPVSLLSIKTRESYLVFVDMFGKWSLIDFFVMMMMMCAFVFNLGLANNAIVIQVFVVPNLGFFTFLAATMMSLGLGHICIACHRTIVQEVVQDLVEDLAPKESIVQHLFRVEGDLANFLSQHYLPAGQGIVATTGRDDPPDNNQHVTVQATMAGKIALFVFLLFTFIMTLVSSIVNTFQFNFKGLTGWLLKSAANVDYGFTTVGTSVPAASGKPNDIGVRWMEVSYFVFGMGMPLAFLLLIGYMSYKPLPVARLMQCFVVMEVFNAWAALDVFVVSIVAALLEVQQFAIFIVGDACDGINQIIAKYFDAQVQGDDTCFDVVATLKDVSWTIFLAAIFLGVSGVVFHAIMHTAIEERKAFTAARRAQIVEKNLDISRMNSRSPSGTENIPALGTPLLMEGSNYSIDKPYKGTNKATSTTQSGTYSDIAAKTGSGYEQVDLQKPKSNLNTITGIFVRSLCYFGLVDVAPSQLDPYAQIFDNKTAASTTRQTL